MTEKTSSLTAGLCQRSSWFRLIYSALFAVALFTLLDGLPAFKISDISSGWLIYRGFRGWVK